MSGLGVLIWGSVSADIESWSKLLSSLTTLIAAIVAVWGIAPFEDLDKLVREIFTAARMLARLWPRDGVPQGRLDEHVKKMEEYEAVFWEESEADEINLRLDAIVSAIDASCRAALEGRTLLERFVRWLDRVSDTV